MLQRINNNAYKIDLPGEYNVSATFNVTDLSPFEFADYDRVDSRTNPFQEGGTDVIMDSTTHSRDELAADSSDTFVTNDATRTTTSSNPAWRKDPLVGLGGPMTRSRAKQVKEALHGLIRVIHQETKPRVEDNPILITLLKVIED